MLETACRQTLTYKCDQMCSICDTIAEAFLGGWTMCKSKTCVSSWGSGKIRKEHAVPKKQIGNMIESAKLPAWRLPTCRHGTGMAWISTQAAQGALNFILSGVTIYLVRRNLWMKPPSNTVKEIWSCACSDVLRIQNSCTKRATTFRNLGLEGVEWKDWIVVDCFSFQWQTTGISWIEISTLELRDSDETSLAFHHSCWTEFIETIATIKTAQWKHCQKT